MEGHEGSDVICLCFLFCFVLFFFLLNPQHPGKWPANSSQELRMENGGYVSEQ